MAERLVQPVLGRLAPGEGGGVNSRLREPARPQRRGEFRPPLGPRLARRGDGGVGVDRGVRHDLAGRRRRLALRGDQVAVGELGVEQRANEVEDFRAAGRVVGAEAGAGGDDLRGLLAGLLHPRHEPAQQQRDLRPLGARVGVRLVHHDEPPRPGEQRRVVRPQQQVLEHRVVGDEQLRRPAAEHFARDDLVRRGVGVQPAGVGLFRRRHLGVDVAAEGDRRAGEDAAERLQLVVDQRVHRVEQERVDAGLGVFEDGTQDRGEERERLAAAGAAGDDGVAPGPQQFDRADLVGVERPLRVGEDGQVRHQGRQDAATDQVRDRLGAAVGRQAVQVRPARQPPRPRECVAQLPAQVRVGGGEGERRL